MLEKERSCSSPTLAAVMPPVAVGRLWRGVIGLSTKRIASGNVHFTGLQPRTSGGGPSFEILGGEQPSFPYPSAPGALRDGPMPGGEFFQSLDRLDRLIGHH
jgi:hypothetical protein